MTARFTHRNIHSFCEFVASVYMVSIVSSVKAERLSYLSAISVCVVSLTEMGGGEDDLNSAYF